MWNEVDFEALNDSIARSATEFLFGRPSTLDALAASAFELSSTDEPLYSWPYTGSELRNVEHEWHRLASLVRDQTSPDSLDLSLDVDFEELRKFWGGRLMFGVNAPPPHRGLTMSGRVIRMTLRPKPRAVGDYSADVTPPS
ncbi:hypothetical protein BCL57_001674 [Agromyces flavus]|uniref:Uncharacterized protein n=1 Tax=Agromyces flavus TaxID=589382 RepID=A0ABT1KLZ9_9MICO|nr:hypothetical protein [Agromyces flavus]MCP2367520.1 hypothetical protein [Agromyces flavus]